MKKALKTIGKIVLVSAVIFIIWYGLYIYFILSGIGNPIINLKATKAITEYVEENYPDNDFEEIKVNYNFKFVEYGAQIISQSSVDTRFYISYDDGEIEDFFDEYVTNGMNTYNRLSQEFDDYIELLIEENYPNQIDLCAFDLYNPSQSNAEQMAMGIIIDHVELDGALDITMLDDLGIEPDLTVWFITEDITFENAAEKLIELKALIEKNDIYPSTYSVNLRLPEDDEKRFENKIHICFFPAELIGTDDFIDKVEEYHNNGMGT